MSTATPNQAMTNATRRIRTPHILHLAAGAGRLVLRSPLPVRPRANPLLIVSVSVGIAWAVGCSGTGAGGTTDAAAGAGGAAGASGAGGAGGAGGADGGAGADAAAGADAGFLAACLSQRTTLAGSLDGQPVNTEIDPTVSFQQTAAPYTLD